MLFFWQWSFENWIKSRWHIPKYWQSLRRKNSSLKWNGLKVRERASKSVEPKRLWRKGFHVIKTFKLDDHKWPFYVIRFKLLLITHLSLRCQQVQIRQVVFLNCLVLTNLNSYHQNQPAQFQFKGHFLAQIQMNYGQLWHYALLIKRSVVVFFLFSFWKMHSAM